MDLSTNYIITNIPSLDNHLLQHKLSLPSIMLTIQAKSLFKYSLGLIIKPKYFNPLLMSIKVKLNYEKIQSREKLSRFIKYIEYLVALQTIPVALVKGDCNIPQIPE